MALSNAEKQARHRDRTKGVKPERIDYEAVEKEYGPLPADATIEQQADRYRLCQAQTLFRLWEAGKLPLDLMREMDRIAAAKSSISKRG